MPPTTRYSDLLGARDPIAVMRDNARRAAAVTAGWTPEHFARTYAPGKWSARQIITHLAHTEMALGVRARMALSTPGYVAQKFDPDEWMARDAHSSGPDAVAAFVALSSLNVALFEHLPAGDREVTMSHPEYGSISVDWILHLLAGHQIHHLAQLDATISR
jgi:hypothetical protein